MTKIGNLCLWLLLTGMGFAQSGTTSLQSLVAELRQSSPAIRASEMAVATARYAPKQASALPDTEFMVQHFTVGSPRPFAGYSNSDFAYIGLGASQELPYPGKRALRASVAEHEIARGRLRVSWAARRRAARRRRVRLVFDGARRSCA